jgi:hypothetical protein
MSDLLSTEEIQDLPVGFGAAQPVVLAATRYRQGGRTQYHVAVPVASLVQILVNRPDPNRPLEGNRKVDGNRAKKFGEYLLKNADWVSPAVIVRVPAHELKFTARAKMADGTQWGVLEIPLDILTEIVLLDGQHRTLGVFDALIMIDERISKCRQTLENLRDQNAPDSAIREQEARLKKDREIKQRLFDEHISIDIAEISQERARQMFGDINNNAKGVNPDFTTLLDQRDVVNRIAMRVIETHPLLEDRVELGQSTRMSPANANLIGAKGVADIVRAILVGSGRVGARVEAETTANMAGCVKDVNLFLDTLVNAFGLLGDIREGRIEAKELRERSMLGSQSMLRTLAIVYYELLKGDPENGHRGWSRAEVEDFFKTLEPHLARVPVAEDDLLWMDTKVFLPGAYAPQARTGMFKTLAMAIVGWARNGYPTEPAPKVESVAS